MTSSTHTISPLRQRMIEDMRMRKLPSKTQASYIRVVKRFADFLGRSPDAASAEDLRRYQLYLVDHGISPIFLNATITGLKFLFQQRSITPRYWPRCTLCMSLADCRWY
jgi:integrase/recombinase XerD